MSAGAVSGGAVSAGARPVRLHLPAQLRELAGAPAEVGLLVQGPVTQRTVLDALEALHPGLVGTLRDRRTGRRRAFVRFYVGEEDLSNASPDDLLPEAVARGELAYVVVGAMAGG